MHAKMTIKIILDIYENYVQEILLNMIILS
jgi:hypothetical protein